MKRNEENPTPPSARTRSHIPWWEALRRGYAPHQLAWLMDNPVRHLLLSPSTFANRLQVSETDRILEVGPGSGYFSVELARRVPGGHLELFDLQPEMLAKAKRKLMKEAIGNVGYTTGNANPSFPFPDASFDIAVLVTVLREIPDKEACLAEISRVLDAAGVVVFHEQLPDNLIRFAQLCPMVESAGFVLTHRYGPWWNYTAIFRKPRLPVATAHPPGRKKRSTSTASAFAPRVVHFQRQEQECQTGSRFSRTVCTTAHSSHRLLTRRLKT